MDMKILKKWLLFMVICLVFPACLFEKPPDVVAQNFLDHLNAREYNAARSLGTEKTKQFVNLLESLGQNQNDLEHKPEPVSVNSIEIEGDTAYCYYTYRKEYESIRLIRQDGKWLVDINKE